MAINLVIEFNIIISMKKIISFSLWGSSPKYINGIRANIDLQKQYFKGWKCRFYIHEGSLTDDISQLIIDNDAEYIIISEDISTESQYKTNQVHKGWFWRFKVLEDPSIDYAIVRDLDSRLSLRESNCVRDWIASGKEFHIIRDHVMHGVPICAGMWGVTGSFIRRINYTELIGQFIKPHDTRFGGYDQYFLGDQIYPLVKNTVCIHDDWDRFREGSRKIPHIRNGNEFIGKSFEL